MRGGTAGCVFCSARISADASPAPRSTSSWYSSSALTAHTSWWAPRRFWTASIAANHALRDNLDISARAGIEIEDTGTAIDTTYDANVGLSWKLNPVLSWTAAYDLTWLDAGTGGRSYTEYRVSAGVTFSR